MKYLPIFVVIVGIFLVAPMAAQTTCTGNINWTITWTGAVSTDWNTMGNWNPNGIPGSSDYVCIPAGKTVTNQPGTGLGGGVIESLTLQGALTIDTSSLTLQSNAVTSTINNLTLTSTQGQYGVLTMNGPTTFSGNLVLSPGQVNGSGAATITGPVTASNGSSLGPASVDNQGTITITASNAHVTLGNVSFNNDTTGKIDLQGDGIFVSGNGPFTNSGSITKSMGTGTSTFSPGSPFGNNGTVAAGSGTLELLIVGTSAGVFNANAGATLQFGTSVVTLNSGTIFDGSGTIDIADSGEWDVEAPVMINTTNLAFDGGTGTIIKGNSNLAINSTTVTWNSGVIQSNLGETTITLSKGTTMNIVTSGYHGLDLVNLDVLGTVNMSADLQLGVSNITIKAKAKFNILTDNGIHGSTGSSNIYNGGTFAKTGGTGTSTLDYDGTFNILAKNKEPVTVNSGTLNFAVSDGGTLGGTWTVDGGTTVTFSTSTYTVPEGSKFIGKGTTYLNGATWQLTGNASVSADFFTQGVFSTISGAFDLTLSSKSIVLSGTRVGTLQSGKPVGTIKIPKATSEVSVFNGLTLNACTLDSSSKSFFVQSTVAITNSAVLKNEAPGIMYLDVPSGNNSPALRLDSGDFTNLGTVTMNDGYNSEQTIGGVVPWDNDGKLIVPGSSTLIVYAGYVNYGGVSVLNGGFIDLGGPMNLEGGTVDGSGSIEGPGEINETGGDIEAGNVTPGSGTGILSLSAPLTQGTGAAITALITGTTPGTQYDQINSTSSIALGGTLNLQFGKGFTPTPSQSFNILNFSSVTGNFSTVNAPTGFTANLTFTATALTVSFTSGKDVSIRPKSATVKVDGMMRFTGTASARNRVTWRVTETGGGTVTQTGLYTAPGKPGTYHVVVTSVADKTKLDTATVTVTALAADKPAVAPQAAELQPDAGTTPAVVHNTWTSGVAIPTPVYGPAGTAVLKNEIYVVGGSNAAGSIIGETQIYNPATSTWTTGTALPVATWDGVAAVVKNILYVIGGSSSPGSVTNAVWAYDLKTKTWTTKSPMPTARASIGVAVEKNIIYVVGGTDGVSRFTTVESYNPATDTWTEDASLFVGKSEPSVGLVGTTIVAADGFTPSQWTGDNEGYNASTNAWTSFAPDPTARNGACAGGIGSQLYVAGGYDSFGPALSLTEAFKVSTNKWTTLAALPQNAEFMGAAVYKRQLYCIGGWTAFQGAVLNNVQIYQP